MGARHLARELALKALYELDIRPDSSLEDVALLLESSAADERTRKFAAELVGGVCREMRALDSHLAGVLEHWRVSRLSRIDHNIVRLALYELMYVADVPARVTIDEAIELAKTYGDRDSGRFVNGVLDQLAARLGLKDKGEETPSGVKTS